LLEFTGERVVPGLVDPNLLNEHLARYRLAARYAAGAAVLDAGCGSGYGAAELASAASVTALDISHDALLHAARSYARPGMRVAQGNLEALPFADASFDLVLAFEVIEHLEHWQEMLCEARRVLKAGGVLLVSTPNKSYYTESRGPAGPNPFHAHEFEYEEFRAALNAVFPFVHLWSQNRTEAMVFVPLEASAGTLDAAGDDAPGEAHFYLAACSAQPVADTTAFGWLPETGNLLRERERHIALLLQEVALKNTYVKDLLESQTRLMEAQDAVNLELSRANAWAESLGDELEKSGLRIHELQNEVPRIHAAYQERIRTLGEQDASRLAWVADLESQIKAGNAEIERLEGERLRLVNEVGERTAWAQSLDEELRIATGELNNTREQLAQARALIRSVAGSKWLRAGRAIHLGPNIDPVIEAE
jgi:ubiquinone/menaquinone biosynthesis C-methylase UbiE